MKKSVVIWIFTGLFFVAATAAAPQAKSAFKQKRGNLYELVERASKNQIPGNSDLFRVPAPEQLAAWRKIVESILNNRLNDAAGIIKKHSFPYQLTLFTDKTGEREYVLLEEKYPLQTGWGFFVFDLQTENPLVLEIPHPVFDGNTEFQGIEAFLQTEARAFLLAGAHRRANWQEAPCTQPKSADADARYPVSDVAHAVVTPFHAVHETLVKLKPNTIAVQLHGMRERDICPNAFLSTGTATVTTNSKKLLACLVKNGVETEIHDGTKTCPLIATSNVQGRFSNGETNDPCRWAAKTSPEPGTFLHLEQEPEIRRDRKSWQPVIDALKCAFPADENAATPIATKTEMRLEGKHTFRAAARKNEEIVWQLSREETGEAGGAAQKFENIAQTKGTSAVFDLPKIAGKETIYTVLAKRKNSIEIRKIQVFEPNVRTSFTFKSPENPAVRVYAAVPGTLSPKTKFLMVLTGRGRNADDYLDSWIQWGAKNDYLILTPYFDQENWREPLGYNYGNIASGREKLNQANPKSKWAFTVVEQIFSAAREAFSLKAEKYDLFGHSAGGQFVHRFMLFYPENRVRLAIAANPGFYTLPDANEIFPYGLKNSPVEITRNDLLNWTKQNVIIMRGTADVERTENLRQTPEADAQGKNRFERAAFMFAKIRALNPKTKWRLIDVPNVAHAQKGMALAAQNFLESAR